MKISWRRFLLLGLVVISTLVLIGCPDLFGDNDNGGNGSDGGGTIGIVDDGTDTDGDGLADYDEVQLHKTDPLLPDTDGDGVDDKTEVESPGLSPLLAELPIISVWVSRNPSLVLNKSTSAEESTEELNTQLQSHSSETSRQHQQSTEHVASHKEEVSAELSYGMGGASGSVSASASFEETTTNMSSSSWSQSSTNAAQTESQKAASVNISEEYSHGTITTGITLQNIGKRSVNLRNFSIDINLKDYTDVHAVPTALARLDAEIDSGLAEIALNAGSEKTFNLSHDEIQATLMYQVFQDPRKLAFDVGRSYVMEDNTGREINYASVAENVLTRTSTVSIDYGDGTVDVFLVATGVERDGNGDVVGMTMPEVFELISRASTNNPDTLSFDTEEVSEQIILENITRDGKLYANELREDDASRYKARWYRSSNASNATTTTNCNNLRLKPGNSLQLIYIKDTDGDGLIDRLEGRYGTDINEIDTDGDDVSDYKEVIDGTDPLNGSEIAGQYPGSITLYSLSGKSGEMLDHTGHVEDLSTISFSNGDTLNNAVSHIVIKDGEDGAGVGVLLFEEPQYAAGRVLYLQEGMPAMSRRLGFGNSHSQALMWTAHPSKDTDLHSLGFDNIVSSILVFDPDTIETDTDGDGIPDAVEQYLSEEVFQESDRQYSAESADYDSDGLNDWFELLFDLDPRNSKTNNLYQRDLYDSVGFLADVFPNGVYFFSEPDYGGVFEGYGALTDRALTDDNAIGSGNASSLYMIGSYLVALYPQPSWEGTPYGGWALKPIVPNYVRSSVSDLGGFSMRSFKIDNN